MSFSFREFLNFHHIEERELAVGVSGGSDSLALILGLNEELSPEGYRIVALTVDHRLRPTSTQEATGVSKLMAQFGIEHHTLPWTDVKPSTGLEEAAREARYRLLGRWCRTNGIRNLVFAHQQDDQAETFFMRLQRGSGLEGLCGMRPVRTFGDLRILRPLLSTPKTELQTYLKQKNITWAEDESNLSDAYLRNKIRHFLPAFYERTGLDARILSQTMERLQKARDFITRQAENILNNNVRFVQTYGCAINQKVWNDTDTELRFWLLNRLLKQIGQTTYPPRAERTMALRAQMESDKFKSATLGQCEILRFREDFWIVRETKTPAPYSQKIWQNYLQEHPEFKKTPLPYKLRLALLTNF